MKTLLLAKGREDPATRYRAAPVMGLLGQRGDTVVTCFEPHFMRQLYVLAIARRFDLIFIQRKLFSSLFIRLLRRLARKIVFDFDDAIFLRSNGQESKNRRAKFDAVVKASDQVIAGNGYLAETAAALGANVMMVPTSVDCPQYGQDVEKLSQVTLVWIGSSSTSKYLEDHREILETIGKEIPDIRLRVIADFQFHLEHLETDNIGWSETGEARDLGECHIGIAPMIDNNWTRGKCALKVIQYMAAGLPVVSAAVGANRDIVLHGATGYLATGTDAWVAAIRALHQSAELRSKMGQSGRQLALAHYSRDAAASRILASIDQLCGR